MHYTIAALVESQSRDRLLYPEDFPNAIVNRVGYGRLQRWLQNTWHRGGNDAHRSHDARPWGPSRYTEMLCSLYPDTDTF